MNECRQQQREAIRHEYKPTERKREGGKRWYSFNIRSIWSKSIKFIPHTQIHARIHTHTHIHGRQRQSLPTVDTERQNHSHSLLTVNRSIWEPKAFVSLTVTKMKRWQPRQRRDDKNKQITFIVCMRESQTNWLEFGREKLGKNESKWSRFLSSKLMQ